MKIFWSILVFPIILIIPFNGCGKLKPPYLSSQNVPVAFNQNIPAYNMNSEASEVGISLARNIGLASDSGLDFYNLPIWYRKNFLDYIDVGFRSIIIPQLLYMCYGPELIIGKRPIKFTVGFYPFSIDLLDTLAYKWIRIRKGTTVRFKALWLNIGIYNWWQTNLLFGAGPEHFNVYGGIRTSPLAIGPLFGLNFNLEDEWALRSEGALLFKPPWQDQEVLVKGSSFSLGISFVKTFGEFEY
ncbi:MAG: hypothetical protein OEW70_03965 [candidate division WOR-3 bacterium]|nr:hypothetical protein [candidate division WOR-3 bacterium]